MLCRHGCSRQKLKAQILQQRLESGSLLLRLSGIGLDIHPGIMLLVISLEGNPHRRAALEAGAKCQLPHTVPLLYTLECLHIGPRIPAAPGHTL